MALIPPLVFAALMNNRNGAANSFSGPAFPQLALGLANGLCLWAVGQPQNLALAGVASGSAGGGAIVVPSSKVTVTSSPSTLLTAFAGVGLLGPLGQSLAEVVSLGVSEAFTQHAQYSGVSVGVAVGQDVSKVVVANGPSLAGILRETLAGAGVAGAASNQLALALGNGIAALLLTGGGTATVTGTPVVPPAPGAGKTDSVVI